MQAIAKLDKVVICQWCLWECCCEIICVLYRTWSFTGLENVGYGVLATSEADLVSGH